MASRGSGPSSTPSGPSDDDAPDDPTPSPGERLLGFIERVEGLHAERTALGSDISAIYGECGSAGFDVKVVKVIVGRRRQGRAAAEQLDGLVANYQRAIDAALAAREASDAG